MTTRNQLYTALGLLIVILVLAGVYLYGRQPQPAVVSNNAAPGIQNQNQAQTPPAPVMSFKLADFSCEQGNKNFSHFNILRDSETVAIVDGPSCTANQLEFLAQTKQGSYFSVLPGGIGGYILYGKYINLYYLNFADNKIQTVFTGSNLTDLDFTAGAGKVVYMPDRNKLVVKDLPAGKSKTYGPAVTADNAQMGDFKFSPDASKVAVAVGYGPDNEHGEIYILDLATGKYSLYQKTQGPPTLGKWTSNSDIQFTDHFLSD